MRKGEVLRSHRPRQSVVRYVGLWPNTCKSNDIPISLSGTVCASFQHISIVIVSNTRHSDTEFLWSADTGLASSRRRFCWDNPHSSFYSLLESLLRPSVPNAASRQLQQQPSHEITSRSLLQFTRPSARVSPCDFFTFLPRVYPEPSRTTERHERMPPSAALPPPQ